MYVCDYNDWYVVAKMDNAAGDGAVKTYPNVHKDFNASPALSSFSAISSSFAHAGAPRWNLRIRVRHLVERRRQQRLDRGDDLDRQLQPGAVRLGSETVTFDGQSYRVYRSGSYIAFVDTNNVTSGTLNLSTSSTTSFRRAGSPRPRRSAPIDYGVELVSTNGADATFTVSDFSLTTM